MDAARFDRLVAAVAGKRSRRRLVGSIGAMLLGLLAGPDLAAGKKKKKRHKKRQACPQARPVRCGAGCCGPTESCRNRRCVDHCDDGERNFGETDVDCGGPCAPARRCGLGQFCAVDGDCVSGVCALLEDIDPTRKVCGQCRLDSECAGNVAGPRCIENRCRACAADFDCSAAAGTPFCVALPTCPNGEPCACAQCRTDADCQEISGTCNPETGSCFT